MNFLLSLRSDLLSRRLLPLVVLVCVGLAGAVAYVLSSSSSSTPTARVTATPSTPATSNPLGSVTQAPANPSSNETVAETTDGRRYQRQGKTHNPFKTQPEPVAKATKATSAKSTSPSSSSAASGTQPSSSPTTTTNTGGSTPTQTGPKPKKPQTVYSVNVELGAATTPGEIPTLTLYKKVKIDDSLPKKNPLVVLKSANLNTKTLAEGTLNGSATFGLTSAPILKGPGVCIPSTTQCESIKLSLGQVEELQVLEPDGQNVTYLLRVAFIFRLTV
ncbi:MAG TPA: hypothetical protein VID48_08900 [Solirubrobacteraceae bacterium]|jgi:hypothetical protein